VDYAIDLNGGRPGLLLRWKRQDIPEKPLQAQLSKALLLALRACLLLEKDPSLQGQVKFRTDEVEIAFLDRLHTPNTTETLNAYAIPLQQFLEHIFPGSVLELKPVSVDIRDLFTVYGHASNALGLDTLIQNLETVRITIQAGMTTGCASARR
jgi:hypothetical protein